VSRVTRIFVAIFASVIVSLLIGAVLARFVHPNAPRGALLGFGELARETLSTAAAIALCAVPGSIAAVWRGSSPKPKRRMSSQHIPPRLDTARAKEVVQIRLEPEEALSPAEPHLRRRRRRARRSA
jgi:hypothetical protein